MAKYEVVMEGISVKVSVDLLLSPEEVAKLDALRNETVSRLNKDISMDSFINTIVDVYIYSN